MLKFFKGLKIPKHYRLWLIIAGGLIVLGGISFFIYRSVASASFFDPPGGGVEGYFINSQITVKDATNTKKVIPGAVVTYSAGVMSNSDLVKYGGDGGKCTVDANAKDKNGKPLNLKNELTTDQNGVAQFFNSPNHKDLKAWARGVLSIPIYGNVTKAGYCSYTLNVTADGYKDKTISGVDFTKKLTVMPKKPDGSLQGAQIDTVVLMTPDPTLKVSVTNNVNNQTTVNSPYVVAWDVNAPDTKTTCKSEGNWPNLKTNRKVSGEETITSKAVGDYTYTLTCTDSKKKLANGTTTVKVVDTPVAPEVTFLGTVKHNIKMDPNGHPRPLYVGFKYTIPGQKKETFVSTQVTAYGYLVHLFKPTTTDYKVNVTLYEGDPSDKSATAKATTSFNVTVKGTQTASVEQNLVFTVK